MAFYTKQQARNEARSESRKSFYNKSATTILRESASSSTDYQKFDVFLSHSIDDAELVLGVKTILEKQGLKVYVDWDNDSQLSRDKVTKNTAEVLRVRMRQSKSLIYIATDNSSSSKWMPWELGYFDGFKNGGVAILPLLDNEHSSFAGQEYLSLYPTVKEGMYRDGRKDVFVEEKCKWDTLKNFGQGSPNWQAYR